MDVYLGVDLSASRRRKSAYALLYEDLSCKAGFFSGDDELVALAEEYSPRVVGIDAPLSFPKGGRLRGCDKALLRLGVKVFSPVFSGMLELTSRGIKLKEALEERGFEVIEVYPGGSQDLLGIPRKSRDKRGLLEGLRSLGVKFEETLQGDILDAITAAFTSYAYAVGEYILVSSEDCRLILPSPTLRPSRRA